MEGHRPPFGQLLERRPCPAQTVQVDVVTGVRGEVEGTPALVRIPRHLDLERPQAATEMPLDVQTVGAGVRARPGRGARASDDDQYPHRDEKTSAPHGGLLCGLNGLGPEYARSPGEVSRDAWPGRGRTAGRR